jgi:thioredoxin-like negative regulator of GroEL
VLPGDPTPCPAEDTEAEIERAFAETIAAPHPDTAAVLHLAAHLYRAGGARAACALMDGLPDLPPDTAPEAAAAVMCLYGSVSAAAATEYRREGESAEAIDRHAFAARHYAGLGLRSQVLRELERMVDCAEAATVEEVTRAAVLLRMGVAPRLEADCTSPPPSPSSRPPRSSGAARPRDSSRRPRC